LPKKQKSKFQQLTFFINLKSQKIVLIAVKSADEIIPLIQQQTFNVSVFLLRASPCALKLFAEHSPSVYMHYLAAHNKILEHHRLVVRARASAFIPSGALFAAA
jgi:hypothetical protein